MEGAEGNRGIEFSLGFPLNDGFGVDPTRKKLRLSSSGSNVVVTDNSLANGRNTQANLVALGAYATTVRACSMPSETREGCRRNELQSVGTSSGLHADADGVSGLQGQPLKTVAASNTTATYEESLSIDMPYVSTRGLGPSHSKIQGVLYRYRRIEEVKIVCVCHGLFLSPAEFVKHGGGGDVAHPLKHIVVIPFTL